MHHRPSPKELDKQLRRAREALSLPLPAVVIIDVFKWDQNWDEFRRYIGLDYESVSLQQDRFGILLNCLQEVRYQDHRWLGKRIFSNKRGFESVELFEFRWLSTVWVSKRLYIKFGFKSGKLCMLSFHPDRPEKTMS